MNIFNFLFLSFLFFSDLAAWELGPFERLSDLPLLSPNKESEFSCPLSHKKILWESEHVFNPGAVFFQDKVHLIYRAEDNFGQGIGRHTSRLGLASSVDGIHFMRSPKPVLFPTYDDQLYFEWPGGCEDPRIVEREDGTFVMTYTQWNRKLAQLAVATSHDLVHWKKHGYAFQKFARVWSKSGSIVCKVVENRLIAAKISGKYWMYWGEGTISLATSDDLISWTPLFDHNHLTLKALEVRPGKFDSGLVECGPPAVITKHGIVLLYNGKNSPTIGDPLIAANSYSAGQALFSKKNPTKLLARSEKCFLTPTRVNEIEGQYKGGTVFVQGLVPFQDKWFLYYGSADSTIGAASCPR